MYKKHNKPQERATKNAHNSRNKQYTKQKQAEQKNDKQARTRNGNADKHTPTQIRQRRTHAHMQANKQTNEQASKQVSKSHTIDSSNILIKQRRNHDKQVVNATRKKQAQCNQATNVNTEHKMILNYLIRSARRKLLRCFQCPNLLNQVAMLQEHQSTIPSNMLPAFVLGSIQALLITLCWKLQRVRRYIPVAGIPQWC